MTVTVREIRLDEKKIVVVRRVPMTSDTTDKLRKLRAMYEEQLENYITGEKVKMPFPVVIDKVVEEVYSKYFPGE